MKTDTPAYRTTLAMVRCIKEIDECVGCYLAVLMAR
jgi:hypothetical protein